MVAALVFALGWLWGEFRTRTGWDDTYYLLQVSSLVEDGDLDLRNDALGSTLAPRELQAILTATLPSGSLKNTFSIGPVVLWLPAYLAARPWPGGAVALGGRRWSRAQMAALHLLSLSLLAGVAWFLFRLIDEENRGLALLATLTLLIGTPLAVYGPAVYTMAHLPSAVAVCLFMASVLWLERDGRPYRALLAGVALGLVFLVRWQDAVFALLLWVPFAPLLGKRRDLPRLALLLAATAAGALAVASLQLHAWSLEQGSWLTMPQGEQYMHWTQPHLRELVFSGYSGLLAWSPVVALAAAGLLLPWRCRLSARWRLAALAVLAIEVYVNAAVRDWWGGSSFGARRMSSCVPLLALGLANLGALAAASSRRRRRPLLLLLGALLGALCLWGCFVTNLYWQQVHDLSLVLRGSPALDAQQAPQESGVLTDPVLARRRALQPAGPVVQGLPNYFAGVRGVRRSAGIVLTLALMGVAVAASCLLLSRVRGPSLLQAVLPAILGLVLWSHERLFLGPRPDPGERALWRRLAMQWEEPRRQLSAGAALEALRAMEGPGASTAPPPGPERPRPTEVPATPESPKPPATPKIPATPEPPAIPESPAIPRNAQWVRSPPLRVVPPGTVDAYRYLAMLASWEGGEPAPARRLLERLAANGYPAAVALRQQVEALGPGAEVLRLLPGAFFTSRPGDAGRVISLPAAAASGVRDAGPARWEVVFDLRPGVLERAALYDVVTLQDVNRAELARVSLRGGGRVVLATTPRGSAEVTLDLSPGRLYRVRLRDDPRARTMSLIIGEAGSSTVRLSAPLAPGAAAPMRLLFGRNRQDRASYPLWSSTFSELWVVRQRSGTEDTAPRSGRAPSLRAAR